MPAQEMADDMHSVAEHRLRRIDQRYTAGRRAIITRVSTAGRFSATSVARPAAKPAHAIRRAGGPSPG